MPIERPTSEAFNFGLADYLEAGMANFVDHLVRNTTLDPAIAAAVVANYVANGGFIGGINGVTVQDEGAALATAGTTLNFVGAGVTAAGATAVKTITIPGGAASPQVEAIATGVAYTLVAADATKIKRAVDAAAQTINITTAFNGLACTIEWLAGAGTVTLDANVGVNLNGLGDAVNIVLSQAAGAIDIIPTGANTFDVVGAIGDFLASHVTDSTATGRSVLTAATVAAGRAALAAAAQAQSWAVTFSYPGTVAAGSYFLCLKLPFGVTVTEQTSICTSGTGTATGKINAVALGGVANAVSSVEQSQAHASANVAAAGDDLVVEFTALTACVNPVITMSGTRNLAA